MKNLKKLFSYLMVMALMISFSPISVYAATNDTFEQKINDQLDSISGKTIESENGNGSVTINNVKLDMDSESFSNLSDTDKEEVYNQVTEAVNNIKNIECNVTVEKIRQKREVDAPVKTYKANIDVWCGVPAIGHGYLRIRYETSRQNGYFFNGEVLDSWITKGLTVADWTHHYGEVEYGSSGRTMDVIAYGTLAYPVDLKGQSTNVRMDVSFLGTVE